MKDDDLMREVARAMKSELDAEASMHAARLLSEPSIAAREALVDRLIVELAQPMRAKLKSGNRLRAARAAVFGFCVLAAGVCLALRSPIGEQELPTYTSSVSGDIKKVRSVSSPTAARPLQLGAAAQIDWLLRPERPVAGKVTVRTWYRQTRLVALSVNAEVSNEGSVRITGQIADWRLPRGRVTVYAVVGREADVPRSVSEIEPLLAAAKNPFRVAAIELELLP